MFWLTKTSVLNMLGEDYIVWRQFGLTHLCWLTLLAALIILVIKFYPQLTPEKKRRVQVVLVCLMVADELFKDIPALITGQFEWEFLPFHLCSVNLFISVLHAIKPGRKTSVLLTCCGLPAALAAMLFPNWTSLPVWNYMHLHSSTVHIMLILMPVIILADGFRPCIKDVPLIAGYIIALACLDKALNTVLGTNFMFLTHNENNPMLVLIESLTGKFYNPAFVLIIIVCCSLFAILFGKLPNGNK
ncbi:MAG: YwaF family protein [Eubacteriales bacterium]|nr:YwaF family protein [Eubacteriales bacterium]